MKRVLFFSILFAVGTLHAQDILKKYGYNKEPLTLSKGRYKETFINENVMQIGTVLIDTRTYKVVKFLEGGNSKVSYKAENTSRFLTMDPLAEKFPQQSPYVFCSNNPVNRIDPTGLTDYQIGANGYISDASSLWDKIKRLWNGPDKTDKLIAPNGSTLTMKAGTMADFTDTKNKKGITIGQTFKIGNSDVAEQVHEFLSENVTKEYGVIDDIKNGESTSTITTTLGKNTENDAPAVALERLNSGADVIQITHNHPIGYDPTPSGYKPGQRDINDKLAVEYFNNQFPNNFIIHRVYDPTKKVYIYYDANKIYKTEPKKIR